MILGFSSNKNVCIENQYLKGFYLIYLDIIIYDCCLFCINLQKKDLITFSCQNKIIY